MSDVLDVETCSVCGDDLDCSFARIEMGSASVLVSGVFCCKCIPVAYGFLCKALGRKLFGVRLPVMNRAARRASARRGR